MKTKLIYIVIAIFTLVVSCSKSDPEVEVDPDYGNLTANVNGDYTVFKVYQPFTAYQGSRGDYQLGASCSLSNDRGLLLYIYVDDSIAKPGSYTYNGKNMRAVLHTTGPIDHSGAYNIVGGYWDINEMNLAFSIFNEQHAKGTFELRMHDTLYHFTNGKFDVKRID